MNKVLASFAFSLICIGMWQTVAAQKVDDAAATGTLQSATKFLSAEAFSDGGGAWLRWQMVSEHRNIGFHVYRVNGDRKERANAYLIAASFISPTDEVFPGGTYNFFDPKGASGVVYFIESVGLFGENSESQLIRSRTVSDIAQIAGKSSAELAYARSSAEPVSERNHPILPDQLGKEISENLRPANLSNQRLVASQAGVKIGVKKEGIYRVTRAELQAGGFDVGQPSANWQLYRNGNEQAIIVGSNGDYIEFYGNGIDTIDSAEQIYFLINGSVPGKRVAPRYLRGISGNVIGATYNQAFSRVDRVIYFNTLRNGDANNYFSDKIVNSTGVTIPFTLDAIDFTSPKTTVEVKVQGLTVTPHNIAVTLNGEPLGFITGNNTSLMTGNFQLSSANLIEGVNSLLLKVPSGTSDISLFYSVKVSYARFYKAKQNALSFYTNHYRKSIVNGFSSQNIRVFDISYPDDPALISNLAVGENNGDFSVTLPSYRPKLMFAAEDSALLQATSITENTPSTLSTVNHNARLVIISYKGWLDAAEAWATYRRNDGFTVEVVRIDDIFDEFSYGIVDSNAIRAFLLFGRNNWQTPPDYALVLGDATYDPRNYLGFGDFNYVPTKMVDTVYEETGSDEAMADFNDDGLAEIAIGRIPARSSAGVMQILNKVIAFEPTAAQGFSRGALFVSDLPEGYDFDAMGRRIASELPGGTPITYINRADLNARGTLLSTLDTGKYLVNYTGHGSTGVWANAAFYGLTDPLNMANGDNLTIFTMLTCLNGYFLSPTINSLSEYALAAPNGGGVAVWSSTGKTTPDVQEVLARRFYQQFSAGNMLRMGDLIKDAKEAVSSGRDVRLSWVLLGDPTLKVR